jgi:hypothetical protein
MEWGPESENCTIEWTTRAAKFISAHKPRNQAATHAYQATTHRALGLNTRKRQYANHKIAAAATAQRRACVSSAQWAGARETR